MGSIVLIARKRPGKRRIVLRRSFCEDSGKTETSKATWLLLLKSESKAPTLHIENTGTAKAHKRISGHGFRRGDGTCRKCPSTGGWKRVCIFAWWRGTGGRGVPGWRGGRRRGEKMRGEGVAEGVGMKVPVDVDEANVFFDDAADGARREAAAGVIEEDGFGVRGVSMTAAATVGGVKE